MEKKTLKNVVFIEAEPKLFVTRYDCEIEGFHWPHRTKKKMKHLLGELEVEAVCPGSGGEGLLILQKVGGLERKWLVVDADMSRRVHEVIKAMEEPVKVTAIPCLEVEREVYAGTRMSCGKEEQHRPHITGTYDTVRYGVLHYYCPGKSGEEYEIYEDRWFGDVQTPDRSLMYIVQR
jgi:hypothetical protein